MLNQNQITQIGKLHDHLWHDKSPKITLAGRRVYAIDVFSLWPQQLVPKSESQIFDEDGIHQHEVNKLNLNFCNVAVDLQNLTEETAWNSHYWNFINSDQLQQLISQLR